MHAYSVSDPGVMDMIEAEHVSKRYGRVEAVKDLSFSMKAGEIVGLLGVNGAGKTTTLNILTGCMPPTSGRVLIDHMDLQDNPALCRRKIGYMPEKPPLYDEMNVEEFLRFVCRLRYVERASIPAHIQEILEKCGLTQVRKRLLGQLSKGFRQRVNFAQALCASPEVLVLDEPTVGLDPRQVQEIRGLIRDIGKERTILFSSHILSEVQQLCARAIVIHEGCIRCDVDLTREAREAPWILSFLGPRDRVLPALRSLPCIRSVRETPGEGVSVLLSWEASADTKACRVKLFSLLSAMEVPILSLTQQKQGLEEIFLRETQEAESV